jgi:hypothetical protein
MSTHRTAINPTDDGRWISACSCRGYAPKIVDTAQQAEDLNLKHEAEVERARISVRKMPPSLRESRDYYRARASDPETPPETARLWAQLADELDKRLNDAVVPHEGQSRLW